MNKSPSKRRVLRASIALALVTGLAVPTAALAADTSDDPIAFAPKG